MRFTFHDLYSRPCWCRRRFIAGFGLGLILFSLGCSSDDGLYPVHGTVTYDGNPIESGHVFFRKVEGDQKGFAGVITNGHYELMAEAGSMTVEILASRPTGRILRQAEIELEEGEQFLPAKFNTETILTAKVSRDDNEISFELSSEPEG